MATASYPTLLEINTRVWLADLARQRGAPVTLADVPDAVLDRFAQLGFDWIYLLGAWQTGAAGRKVSLSHPEWWRDVQAQLPDFSDDDVCGSPFAVRGYTVHDDFGGNAALAAFRARLARRGQRLLLDFVPNHTAIDHRWAEEWPEFYIQGDQADLQREPANFRLVMSQRGPTVIAYGRDPYFPAWQDTLQLNYRHAVLREAMMEELTNLTHLCDGVRCDMAMLLLPDVIQYVWGERSRPRDGSPPVDTPFWPEAISRTLQHAPRFLFVAEVYWDLEWTLQQQGFDYTYDKRHYDRLYHRDPPAVRGHLRADAEFQRRSVRFLENHDEPRVAALYAPEEHLAAAVLTFLVPGLRFFHEGQLEGRRCRASLHVRRRPSEKPDATVVALYERLLAVLRRPEVRGGRWRLLEAQPARPEDGTWNNLVAFCWEDAAA
jgi:glycosidase